MKGRGLLEAILFVCGEPVAVSQLAEWMDLSEKEILALTGSADAGSGLVIRRLEDRLQLATNPEYAGELKRIFAAGKDERLSDALLETLAIVAYQQPVTRQEIDDIRGVHSAYALSALADRGLIERVGTKDVLGRPALYGTTEAFLRQFDLATLQDLPPLPDTEPNDEAPAAAAPEEKT